MTGWQSKKKSAQVRWLGPYEPTDRFADEETLNHVIALRKENEMLQDALRQATLELTEVCMRNIALKKGIQDIMEYYYIQDRSQLNQLETILRLRGAIEAMKGTP